MGYCTFILNIDQGKSGIVLSLCNPVLIRAAQCILKASNMKTRLGYYYSQNIGQSTYNDPLRNIKFVPWPNLRFTYKFVPWPNLCFTYVFVTWPNLRFDYKFVPWPNLRFTYMLFYWLN